MPYATQWLTPPGGRPSGSNIRSAKLLVPAGGFAQDSAGETFSPTQFGFCLLLPAILVCSRSPSLNEDDVIVKAFCAFAFSPLHANARTAAAAIKSVRLSNMVLPPWVGFTDGQSVAVRKTQAMRLRRGQPPPVCA